MHFRGFVASLFAVVIGACALTSSSPHSLASDLVKAGAEGHETLQACVFGLLQAGLPEREAFEMCQPLVREIADARDHGDLETLPDRRPRITGEQLQSAAAGVQTACAGEGVGGDLAPRECDPSTQSCKPPLPENGGYTDQHGNEWECDKGTCAAIAIGEPFDLVRTPPPSPDGGEHPEDGSSVSRECRAAVENVMALLNGCRQIDWVSGGCSDLVERLACKERDLIYVDPDSGYTCGEMPDEKTVAGDSEAWCKGTRVDGPSCARPELERGRFFYRVINEDNICNSPYAYTDGEVCVQGVAVPPDFDPRGGGGLPCTTLSPDGPPCPSPDPTPGGGAWRGYTMWMVKGVPGSGTLMPSPGPTPPPPSFARRGPL